MEDGRDPYRHRPERANMSRYRRLLDLRSLPDFDGRADPALDDRVLLCIADREARKILRRLAEGSASEKDLQTEILRDREKLQLRLYRLLLLKLIRVVGRDPIVFELDRAVIGSVLDRLATEFGPFGPTPEHKYENEERHDGSGDMRERKTRHALQGDARESLR